MTDSKKDDGRKRAFLTAKDVAERLKVRRKTVYAWIDEGLLLAFRLPGDRQLRIEDSAFDAFLSKLMGNEANRPTAAKSSAQIMRNRIARSKRGGSARK